MARTHADNFQQMEVEGRREQAVAVVAPPAPRRPPSLYELEDDLLAIWNSIDMVEDEKERAEAEQMLLQAYLAAVEKRDRVGQFLSHLEAQQAAIDIEIDRLKALKDRAKKAQDRTELYVIHTIQAQGTDSKGKYPKLDGRLCSFSIAKKPDSVEVGDVEKLRAEYLRVTVTANGQDWYDFVDELTIEQRAAFLSKVQVAMEPDKRAIGAVLKTKVAEAEKDPEESRADSVEKARYSVCGAALKAGGFRLVRK